MLISAMELENICRNMQYQICTNMQKYAIICINPTSMDLKRKYAKVCTKYAFICKSCSHEIYMQNMQKFALPTLLMWLCG